MDFFISIVKVFIDSPREPIKLSVYEFINNVIVFQLIEPEECSFEPMLLSLYINDHKERLTFRLSPIKDGSKECPTYNYKPITMIVDRMFDDYNTIYW